MTCYLFRQGREVSHHVALDRIPELLRHPDALVWGDVIAPASQELDRVAEAFHLQR